MQKFLNFKKFGFTLIELIIVMTIAAILAGVGFSGYMDSMHVQKRQDAALSLQKAYLLINTAGKNNINTSLAAAAGSPCSPTTSPSTDCASSPVCNYTPGTTLNFPCKSNNGLYCIKYCVPYIPTTNFSTTNPSIGYSKTNITNPSDMQYLTWSESLILEATAISGNGQDKDLPLTCQTIYLSDQNNLFPTSCISH